MCLCVSLELFLVLSVVLSSVFLYVCISVYIRPYLCVPLPSRVTCGSVFKSMKGVYSHTVLGCLNISPIKFDLRSQGGLATLMADQTRTHPDRALIQLGGNHTALQKGSAVSLEMFIAPLIQLVWSEGCCALDRFCRRPAYFCSRTQTRAKTGLRGKHVD